jgi:hypothetical protein
MEIKLEIATIKANTPPFGGVDLCWLFSRNQLEFILQDITVFQSSPLVTTAEYQETILPVINLEQHFGLPEIRQGRLFKYLVVRAVAAEKTLAKVIIKTPQALKIQQLENIFTASKTLSLPRNNTDQMGTFSMPDGSIGIFPDFAGISRALNWREDKSQ